MLAATEAEFESALREIEARVDRRLLEAAELRYAIEQELAAERSRVVEQGREAEQLRLELKRMAQTAAAAEAKLSAFEQMLEAVEDDIDERIETITLLSDRKLSEKKTEAQLLSDKLATVEARAQVSERLETENLKLREDISRLNEQLERIRSTWVRRTTARVRRLFAPR